MEQINFENDPFFSAADVCIPLNYPGCLYEVRDQGRTDCCYAFVVVDCLYAGSSIFGGEGLKGSEQELMDCLHKFYPPKGFKKDDIVPSKGLPNSFGNAFQYVKEHGLSYIKDYPWIGNVGICEKNKSKSKITISQFFELTTVDRVKDALKSNIVVTASVVIIRRLRTWSGVDIFGYTAAEKKKFDSDLAIGKKLDSHAVTLIGYGEENGVKYYIAKNSYGSKWGYKGFFKIVQSDVSKHYYPSEVTHKEIVKKTMKKTKDGVKKTAKKTKDGGGGSSPLKKRRG